MKKIVSVGKMTLNFIIGYIAAAILAGLIVVVAYSVASSFLAPIIGGIFRLFSSNLLIVSAIMGIILGIILSIITYLLMWWLFCNFTNWSKATVADGEEGKVLRNVLVAFVVWLLATGIFKFAYGNFDIIATLVELGFFALLYNKYIKPSLYEK